MRRIVVLGAGFAGYAALSALERALGPRRRVRITLVSQSAHFLFTPLLPNVAASQLRLSAITLPLGSAIDRDTELIVDRVHAIDLAARALRADRHTIPFDYLLAAPGAEVDWGAHPEWAEHAIACKSGADAARIRESVEARIARAALIAPAERRSALTFVVAGGGPTGVELAAELVTTLRHDLLPAAPPELERALRFVLVERAERLLPALPAEVGYAAQRALERAGVEVALGRSIAARTEREVVLDDATAIAADTMFWCAGVRPSSLVRASAAMEKDERGRARVDETLQALGHEGVFLAGDSARPPLEAPMTAQIARQQGPIAAHNITAALSGRAPRAWAPGATADLLTLGRGHALIHAGGRTLEGRAAYAAYRLAYAALMPGPLKSARILLEWLESDVRPARAPHGLIEASTRR